MKKVLESQLLQMQSTMTVQISMILKLLKSSLMKVLAWKRVMPRAKGRADRILKRTNHITVVVSDR